MHDTAAHLVDAVIPRVPVRQWVLSLPRWARWILARDAQLASRALAVALPAIFAHYRRRARAMGEEAGRCGAVTFIQASAAPSTSTSTFTASSLTACSCERAALCTW